MQVRECMNDSSHVFKGRYLDGVSCPICGGPVLPKPYDKGEDSNLPYYRDLKKQPSKLKSAISNDLNFDDKSKLKLRAIAEHVSKLADELDRIDKLEPCECGSFDYTIESLINSNTNEIISRSKVCSECHKSLELSVDDELPTRLEGSE